ncbi:MAG: hypothetical protein MK554_07185 [Planctomycetes bacterium]|nr:hypothetical protein [Planctomycetota bacterium]
MADVAEDGPDPLVPPGGSIASETKLTFGKVHIVINNKQLLLQVDFDIPKKIPEEAPDRVSAQIHKGLWADEADLFSDTSDFQ